MWKFCDKTKLCIEQCIQWEVLRDNIEVIDKAIQESGWIDSGWYLCKSCWLKGSVRIDINIYWHYVIWLILIFLKNILAQKVFLVLMKLSWDSTPDVLGLPHIVIWNSKCIQACLFLERPQNLYALKAGFVSEKIRSSSIYMADCLML